MRCFVFNNCRIKVHQETKLIDALEQAFTRKTINREFHGTSIRERNGLLVEINSNRGAWVFLDKAKQLAMSICIHLNRQQAIFERIIVENIRKIGADHGFEAETLQCPRRMFTRTPAAKVMS